MSPQEKTPLLHQEVARKGGYARALKLSPEQRRRSAKKAATARWAKKRAAKSTAGKC